MFTYLCNFTQSCTIAKLCVSVPLGTGQSSRACIIRQVAWRVWERDYQLVWSMPAARYRVSISKRLLLKATGLAPHILVEESCLEVLLYMHVTFDRFGYMARPSEVIELNKQTATF